MRTVNVPLGNRSYPILIGSNLLSKLGKECRRLKLGKRCVVITDNHVAPLYAQTVADSLSRSGFEGAVVGVDAGENSKSLKTVQGCYDELAKHRLERDSFVVALGGGVVGDLAGFIAATYLRGIGFVQVPTTLLAQVDSSVGGKVGVNLKAGKNLVGSFHQPRLVLCDLGTLQTLPERELKAGLAEVIKYGIIHDARFFARLEAVMSKLLALHPGTLAEIVARCCEIKADVVGRDEREGGLRAILNFGHTVGHAIENSVGYGRYLHGEAIAIGQVAAAHLSEMLAGFSARDVTRVQGLFEAAGLPVSLRISPSRRERILEAMTLDKKVRAGRVTFVLAKRLGKVLIGQQVPAKNLHSALDAVSSESSPPSNQKSIKTQNSKLKN